MKQLYVIVVALGLVLASFTTKIQMPQSTAMSSFDGYTKQLTQAEFDTKTQEWSTANPSKTWGGRLSKSEMQEVVNSLGAAELITYRFGAVNSTTTFTMFKGGGVGQPEGESRIIQNGGSSYSYCPTKCGMQTSSTNVTESINTMKFNTQKMAYEQANPQSTFGGSFSKSAMQSIINSLSDFTNINFRYVKDTETGSTALIMIGGSTGQPEGKTLYLMNSGSSQCYCPTYCP